MLFNEVLRLEFEKRRQRNTCYGVGAFARDLGCDQSTVHQILKGKRRLSAKKMTSLLAKIGFSPAQIGNVIQQSVIDSGVPLGDPREVAQYRTTADTPKALSSTGLLYAILSALELRDFKASAKWSTATPTRGAALLRAMTPRTQSIWWSSIKKCTVSRYQERLSWSGALRCVQSLRPCALKLKSA
jgi:hypothetical protein